jgi:hypothetical protein
MAGNLLCIARQHAKHDLRDILRPVNVAAEPADSRRIDERQIAAHEFGVCLVRLFRGITAQQRGVVDHASPRRH